MCPMVCPGFCAIAAPSDNNVSFHEQFWKTGQKWGPPGFAGRSLSPVSEHLKWPQIHGCVIFNPSYRTGRLGGCVVTAVICVKRVSGE